MVSKTLSVSLPDEMIGFLDENPGLSPSKILQGAITNIENSLKLNPKVMELNKELENAKKFIKKLQEDLLRASDFIDSKGLGEEFWK